MHRLATIHRVTDRRSDRQTVTDRQTDVRPTDKGANIPDQLLAVR